MQQYSVVKLCVLTCMHLSEGKGGGGNVCGFYFSLISGCTIICWFYNYRNDIKRYNFLKDFIIYF